VSIDTSDFNLLTRTSNINEISKKNNVLVAWNPSYNDITKEYHETVPGGTDPGLSWRVIF
jgi:hypothetical protein